MDPIVVRTLGIFEEHSGSRRSIPVPFTKLTTPKINSFHQLDNQSRFEFQVVHSKTMLFPCAMLTHYPTVCATPIWVMGQFPLRNGVLLMITTISIR